MPVQHDIIYYAHAEHLWESCAALLHEHSAQGGDWRYVADEHQTDHVARILGAQGIAVGANAIIPAASLGFHASPVRVAPIVAALRDLLLQPLGRPPQGILLLIEMTWAIRSPSGAVYLREYEAALH